MWSGIGEKRNAFWKKRKQIREEAKQQEERKKQLSGEEKRIHKEMEVLLRTKLMGRGNPLTKGEDELFYQSLMNWIELADFHKDKNRKLYFDQNTKINRIQARGTGFQKVKELLSTWFAAGTALLMTVLSSFIAECPFLIKVIIGAVEFVVLALVIRFTSYIKFGINDLNLRRYGETWVRHAATAGVYWEEIYLYVYNLTPYRKMMQEEDKKALFRERIMMIYEDNLTRFASNMRELEEYAGR